jgi:hypothetical protein
MNCHHGGGTGGEQEGERGKGNDLFHRNLLSAISRSWNLGTPSPAANEL